MNPTWDAVYQRHMSDEDMQLLLSVAYPAFVERDGCVLLEQQLDELDFDEIKAAHPGDKRAIEEAINTVDFTDLLDCRLSSEEFHTVVEVIARLWTLRLAELFPGRRFSVDVVDFAGDGAWGIIVTEHMP